MSVSGTTASSPGGWCPSGVIPTVPFQSTAWRHSWTARTTGPSRGSPPFQYDCQIGSVPSGNRNQRRPARSASVSRSRRASRSSAAGQPVVGAQHRAHRIGAQLVHRQAGLVERCSGQGDVDQSRPQPAGRIGQVGLADADFDAGVLPAVRGGQPRGAPVGAVAQETDGDGRGAGRRGDAYAGLVGLLEQGAGLVEERRPGRGERDSCGGAVQQGGAEVGLQLLDRPAQRWLAHVQPRSGPAEVEFLGDGHEVTQRA
ncbi:hypothetical protein VR46_39550 [Streptomyces sp. NRRL S-444]|nr:hypothetical protein VR46_39550 [Streptomyces sp. NRRL S-444]